MHKCEHINFYDGDSYRKNIPCVLKSHLYILAHPIIVYSKNILLVHSIIAFYLFSMSPCQFQISRAVNWFLWSIVCCCCCCVFVFFRKEICHLWLIQTFFLLCIECRVLGGVLMEKFHLGLNSPKSPHLCTTLSGGTLFSFPSTLRNFFDESGVRYWSMPIVISLGVILSLHYFFRVTAVDFPLSLCLI